MATIITVHGTGATGPEEGQAWWQKGSPFDKHMRELVEGEDGELIFQPMIWDGANSEISRRIAASKLHERMQQLESKNQKYCAVGHSHGGSVISNTLLLAGSQSNHLPRLARLISVGTPFIQSVKSFWLFSRSGLIGKSALVSAIAYIFLQEATLWADLFSPPDWSPWLVQLFVYGIPPLALLYGFLWVINRRRFYMYHPKIVAFSASAYSPRLVQLYHKDDEAINGLKSLRNLNITVFQRTFAVPLFLFAALFIPPLLLVGIAAAPPLTEKLLLLADAPVMGDVLTETFRSRLGSVTLSIELLAYKPIASLAGKSFYQMKTYEHVLFGFIPVTALILVSLGITYGVGLASRYISSILSVGLNHLTWQQIRKVGFGNDTMGEVSINADSASLLAGLSLVAASC